MKKLLLYIISILVQLSVQAQTKAAEDYYVSAFNEMSDMLAGRDTLSIKRAVFLAEWAYYEGKLDYKTDFCDEIERIKKFIRSFYVVNKLHTYKTGMQMAISSYMVRPYSGNNYTPYTYDFEAFLTDNGPWEQQFVSRTLKIGNNEECIIYEFGFSKIISVYIVKNDAHFDVYISDGNKVNLYTSCEMSPILNWAFEKAPNEIAAIQIVENKDYKPLYYKLTVMVESDPIVIDTSAMRIIGNEAFVEKVDELKRFIISLWMNYLDAQNDDKIAQHTCRVGKSS